MIVQVFVVFVLACILVGAKYLLTSLNDFDSKKLIKESVAFVLEICEEISQEHSRNIENIGTLRQWEDITEKIKQINIPNVASNARIRFGEYVAVFTPVTITFTSSVTNRFAKFMFFERSIRLALISKDNSQFPKQMTFNELCDLVTFLYGNHRNVKEEEVEEEEIEMKERETILQKAKKLRGRNPPL